METANKKEDLPYIRINEFKAHDTGVRAVRFNNDGQYCMSCGNDKSLKLWNPYKEILLNTYTGHGLEVLDADASADNSQLVRYCF